MKRFVFLLLFIINIHAHCNPIIVGFLGYAPPFSSVDADGKHFYGFCVDLMNIICERSNLQCVYQTIQISQQFNLLSQGKVDLVFAPNPIDKAEFERFIFSLPYLASNGRIVALTHSNFNRLNDMKNKKIGVIKSTLYNALSLSWLAKDNTVITYADMNNLAAALNNGDVDAIFVNDSVAKYIVNNTVGQFKLLGEKFTTGDGYGILALKTNQPLIDQINKALLSMEADGSYLRSYTNYFGN